ncbi:DUF485 domain-containing protein [Lentibacillus sp. N15]|uniref:DUF485 domain-containing protein n=1 Tax=Lentibacillus songyuanensis TaxID=3136161 RepID=UPI0031BA382A
MNIELQHLIQKKWKLLIPVVIFLFVFYFGLPLSLTFFLDWVNAPSPFFQMNWGWLYAFLQIPMTWLFAGFYYIKMKQYDRRIAQLVKEDAA